MVRRYLFTAGTLCIETGAERGDVAEDKVFYRWLQGDTKTQKTMRSTETRRTTIDNARGEGSHHNVSEVRRVIDYHIVV